RLVQEFCMDQVDGTSDEPLSFKDDIANGVGPSSVVNSSFGFGPSSGDVLPYSHSSAPKHVRNIAHQSDQQSSIHHALDKRVFVKHSSSQQVSDNQKEDDEGYETGEDSETSVGQGEGQLQKKEHPKGAAQKERKRAQGARKRARGVGRALDQANLTETEQAITLMRDCKYSAEMISGEYRARGVELNGERSWEHHWRKLYERWIEIGEEYIAEYGIEDLPIPEIPHPFVELWHETNIERATVEDLRAELLTYGRSVIGDTEVLRQRVIALRIEIRDKDDEVYDPTDDEE
ncbi:MAG: hypothetical protein MMC33_007430, partial [Icmadophila ericetorum]|nr:hypothetical protein [Icmadophila ericetorum]